MDHPETMLDAPALRPETEFERLARIQREAEILAAARADVVAGNSVPWSETKRWLIDCERNPAVSAPEPQRTPVPGR